MLNTNKEHVVKWSVQGKIHHPIGGNYRISYDGKPMILPATGGISYNVSVGDSVFNWAGDHVEPGVSIRNENSSENAALMTFACIGNEAKIVSGDAKGKKGYVTGMHGGIDHVLIYFDDETLEDLAIDDKIMVKAYGQGLKLNNYENVHIMNIDPNLFEKLNIKEENGKLKVNVVGKVPAYLMGSGIGSKSAATDGDYDIMTADMEEIKRLGLDKLKFGDLVLLQDCDNTYGVGYLKGAVSIGVVVHSDCVKSGHGPGVTVIMTCKDDTIEGIIDENANIKNYMK
ncbi:DUF4438 domain-containing protein [Romboutsia sp. 1001216sp1]|uniref:DUF4438 domain-containing protein n=1 Tax=Romboutsia TaxID=1501226 RepID=UPI000ADF010A|nr:MULTISPECIES: DUF4438 domain-containing protein [Romboutsia]MDB8792493.1 DUF4438 domain-containing protein [Romboutsia sp. 1001216sp1]MDB8795788.1 DUF4438 domain-containing protein [Romboutsia sp. 1001216sp1]MDB8798333.1 DUF4438 domain-containing protein [Romboutsia sp. 1001216sp1]MDB8803767.1 DUF4438 domain-containing protein [Romboutsia sp. 1001216sp1]MDB8806883.1 DUF4438 domain-containing protein [Romboutsia sp. 1001216sp1]